MTSPILLPRILLTNDDGIDAPGLAVLASIAQEFAHEIWIVAPEHDQSGMGQSLSLHHPLHCTPHGERRWAVNGTPSDCVAVALGHLMEGARPSLILSGVNAGANLGDEVNLSGTAGAVFTALMLGVPAIGLSQDYNESRHETPWDTARTIAPKVLRHLLAQGWRKDTCLLVNIPDATPGDISGFSWARQSQKNVTGFTVEKRTSPRQEDYFWLSLERKAPVAPVNGDCAILQRREVAVTALGLDRSLETNKPFVSFDEAEDDTEAADETTPLA